MTKFSWRKGSVSNFVRLFHPNAISVINAYMFSWIIFVESIMLFIFDYFEKQLLLVDMLKPYGSDMHAGEIFAITIDEQTSPIRS